MKNTTVFTRLSTFGLAASLLFNFSSAQAQREPTTRTEKRSQRQQQTENMTPEQRQQYYQQRMQERERTMTPEQRQRWTERRAQMEQMQRQQQLAAASPEDRQKFLMESAGVTDTSVQDAIMAFAIEQAKQRQSVTEAAKTLSDTLADTNAAPDAAGAQLEKLQSASKEFRTWKEGALKELDAKIGYSKDAKLKSFLVLIGIVGDEGSDAGGFNAIFPKGLAGNGDIADKLPKIENNWGGGNRGGGNGGNAGNAQPAPVANQ